VVLSKQGDIKQHTDDLSTLAEEHGVLQALRLAVSVVTMPSPVSKLVVAPMNGHRGALIQWKLHAGSKLMIRLMTLTLPICWRESDGICR
jgi:hypothetical protein